MKLWIPVFVLLAGQVLAHEGEDEDAGSSAILDAEGRAVVAVLEAFAAAYQATNIDAIRELTLSDGRFSHIEGTYADWDWTSYAGHLGEEMPSFSETRYQLADIRPETHGDMAFATFDWSLDVTILSDQFAGGRHPVSMRGVGTAVLVRSGDDWKLRHLHTARGKAPGEANQSDADQ